MPVRQRSHYPQLSQRGGPSAPECPERSHRPISPDHNRVVEDAGAASDLFTLEGLHLDGGGITFASGARLHVLRCVIANVFINGVINGIFFEPNGPSRLVVTDTVVINNGSGSTGAGILIKPQPGGSALVDLSRVSVQGNVFGIAADGTTSSTGINMTVTDSTSTANSQDGILAASSAGGAPIGITVRNSVSTNNSIGVRSIGNGVTIRLDNSGVIGNAIGLVSTSGGALLSAGNNLIEANGSNGAFSGAVPLK
jgi:hypothetical protein